MPPEIRNSIYRYALQGNYFITQVRTLGDKQRPISSPSEINFLPILLVCRQIYAESALLPIQLSSFDFDNAYDFRAWCKSFNPIQRDTVETVAFELNFTTTCMSGLDAFYSVGTFQKLRNLSSLQEVNFYGRGHWDTIARDQLVEHIRKAAQKKDLRVTFEEH
jgi:hypothetical protein